MFVVTKQTSTVKSSKVHPKPFGTHGIIYLRFLCPQPGTSKICKTMDTGPVCHMVCLFTPGLRRCEIMLFGDRGKCVWTTFPSTAAGNESTIDLRSQVQCPNHHATKIHSTHKQTKSTKKKKLKLTVSLSYWFTVTQITFTLWAAASKTPMLQKLYIIYEFMNATNTVKSHR